MNWVLIVAGLIPLWAALFIVFSNMRVLKDDTPVIMPEAEPMTLQPVQPQNTLELELAEETPNKPIPEEKKSLFAGLLGRFKKEEKDELTLEEEIVFAEPDIENGGSFSIPKGLKRIWGVSLILVFIACLAYGSDIALAYIFKEYRWVIGTTNPWSSQLDTASIATAAIAGVAVMFSTLKTGIHLIRN
ncbi:MAG: hypothetical protein NWF07_03000 [Candidatus Bathyarchaeota archaeon]|nr:hypothetical protein [Candidatus Bathyarchaeota archaeon]